MKSVNNNVFSVAYWQEVWDSLKNGFNDVCQRICAVVQRVFGWKDGDTTPTPLNGRITSLGDPDKATAAAALVLDAVDTSQGRSENKPDVEEKTETMGESLPEASSTLTVGTYNVMMDGGHELGSDRKILSRLGYKDTGELDLRRLNDLSDNMLAADFDVLCLQELTQNMIAKLDKVWKQYKLVSFQSHPGSYRKHGVAILAKHKIEVVKLKTLELDRVKCVTKDKSSSMPRVHVMCRVHLAGVSVLIDSSHFQTNLGDQGGEEIQRVVDHVEKDFQSDVVIIAGDFNKNSDENGWEALKNYERSDFGVITGRRRKPIDWMAHRKIERKDSGADIEVTAIDVSPCRGEKEASDHQLRGRRFTFIRYKLASI